jgi:type I restriction enzyme R subunit
VLNFRKGVRPQKGKNLAIAEWPTASGPADPPGAAKLTEAGGPEAATE